MIGGATSHPHPSSPWPDTAESRRIAGHGRGRSRPRDSARCGPVRLVASVSTSRVHPSLEVQAGVDPAPSDFADRRVPVSPLHPGRGGGTRTPADAVLETAALPLSYTSSASLQNKKPPRSIPGGLPIWGLSSVVSRHRQAHLATREGTKISAPRPMAAAVTGGRWNVHHDQHGAELLRASAREVNRNQRYRQVCGPDYAAAAATAPLIRRPSLLALTRTMSPSLMRPARMWPASGFCSSRWITRFSGRAP